MTRKELMEKYNITIQNIKNVCKRLNISGEIIKGKKFFLAEETEKIEKYIKENYILPKDAILIKGTKTDYITPRGEVYKKNGKSFFKAKLDLNWQGYYICAINYEDGRKNQRVHRLVATYFLIKEDGKDFVNHLDGDKINNLYTNLEWCTESENMIHACATKLLINDKDYEDSQSIPVIMYDVYTDNIIDKFGSMRQASRETNIKLSTISHQLKTECKPRKHKVYFRYDK